ncbi:hypothetical protein LSH36_111g02038 [Paralvinella palmiformis]|uniref:Uncharacterized protein n=1 Tax=Paralvinella palmiformis TaxID=53620 RepID=A0AAD9NC16_9ANNE|nr:hypothetical protein LSH36_111g02038 [Paralvinella palmiformis]
MPEMTSESDGDNIVNEVREKTFKTDLRAEGLRFIRIHDLPGYMSGSERHTGVVFYAAHERREIGDETSRSRPFGSTGLIYTFTGKSFRPAEVRS